MTLGVGAAQAQINAYVAISGATRIDVLDTSSNTLTTAVSGSGNRNLTLSPDGTQLYATTFNAVRVIDTATNTVVASVPTGNNVTAVARSGNGAFLYS